MFTCSLFKLYIQINQTYMLSVELWFGIIEHDSNWEHTLTEIKKVNM